MQVHVRLGDEPFEYDGRTVILGDYMYLRGKWWKAVDVDWNRKEMRQEVLVEPVDANRGLEEIVSGRWTVHSITSDSAVVDFSPYKTGSQYDVHVLVCVPNLGKCEPLYIFQEWLPKSIPGYIFLGGLLWNVMFAPFVHAPEYDGAITLYHHDYMSDSIAAGLRGFIEALFKNWYVDPPLLTEDLDSVGNAMLKGECEVNEFIATLGRAFWEMRSIDY